MSTGAGLLGYNMYAYCNNNPVMNVDMSGESFWGILAILAITAMVLSMPSSNVNVETLEVSASATHYDVPCYDQGKSNYCGLYCQAMVESYERGKNLTPSEADQYVNDLKLSVDGWHEGIDLSQGFEPTNKGTPHAVRNLDDLYCWVQEGPIYASYRHVDGRAHMVVICGVSYEEGLVYTCNPWGIHGVQTFDEFLNHPTGNKWQTWGWNLECVYDIQN